MFQIGSITKIWTTTLVMQLVDDGLLDLDQPLLDHLPELVIGDMDAAKALTTRHLLTHTAGFEGDIFTDTGRGDDALERSTSPRWRELPQLFAPGDTFSYNNTAFVVLGRLVEVLRGKPFDEVLVERIAQPLGLTSVSPSPYEAILHRAATGHVAGRGRRDDPGADVGAGPFQRPGGLDARDDGRATSSASCGCTCQAGAAPDGATVLSAESVRAMQTRQVDLPVLSGMGDALGPRLGALRHRRRASSSPTTAAPSARRRSCEWCPSRVSPSRC